MKRTALCTLLLWGCAADETSEVPSCHAQAAAEVAPAPAALTLPGESLYNLDLSLTTHEGKPARLELRRGQPVLISMFYGSCPQACPLLIARIQQLERELDEATRQKLQVLLVSFDPERDSPEALTALAARHGVDTRRWTFATTSADEVRELAAVLGIKYRRSADGHFDHTTVFTLLDRYGVIRARTEGVREPVAPLIAALHKELRP